MYLGDNAAICIATLVRASLTASLTTAVSASTITPILPPPCVYVTTQPFSSTTFSNLLIDKFSPITAIFSTKASLTVLDASAFHASARNVSISVAVVARACSATAVT